MKKLLITLLAFEAVLIFFINKPVKAWSGYSKSTAGNTISITVNPTTFDAQQLECSDTTKLAVLINHSDGGIWSDPINVNMESTYVVSVPNGYIQTIALDCTTHDSTQLTLETFTPELTVPFPETDVIKQALEEIMDALRAAILGISLSLIGGIISLCLLIWAIFWGIRHNYYDSKWWNGTKDPFKD